MKVMVGNLDRSSTPCLYLVYLNIVYCINYQIVRAFKLVGVQWIIIVDSGQKNIISRVFDVEELPMDPDEMFKWMVQLYQETFY